MSVTTHDIEVEGQTFIMELTLDDDGKSYMTLTSTCDDHECEWAINNATVPSWVCEYHRYDGTGDLPATEPHPEVCDFSDVDEDGECRTEHETYDFAEVA